MFKFPSINQFRHVKKMVGMLTGSTDKTLTFEGTVKLHGSNGSVCVTKNSDGTHDVSFHSKETKLDSHNDNYGFCNYMQPLGDELFIALAEPYFDDHTVKSVVLYGEWCGGKIQKGVALSQLEKLFVIFSVKQARETWAPLKTETKCTEHRIFNSKQFQHYLLDIDFNNPELAIEPLVNFTKRVEQQCPVGKELGVEGIGEGVVWRCVDHPSSRLWFKVKGEKHSVTKVKTLVEVDPVKLASIVDFVDRVVTQARVDQGIALLGHEPDRKDTGAFLSWFFADVMKEESDVLEASGLTKKDVSSKIGERARGMFFKVTDGL